MVHFVFLRDQSVNWQEVPEIRPGVNYYNNA